MYSEITQHMEQMTNLAVIRKITAVRSVQYRVHISIIFPAFTTIGERVIILIPISGAFLSTNTMNQLVLKKLPGQCLY